MEIIALNVLGLLLNGFLLLNGGGLIGVDQVVEQLVNMGGLGGHAMLQHIVGKGVEAQQLRQLTAEIDQTLAYLKVIRVGSLMRTLRIASHIDLLAQVAAVGIGHKGRVALIVERKYPALKALLLGVVGSGLASRLGQSAQIVLVGDVQRVSLSLLQQVLRELQGEQSSLLGQLPELFLSSLVEQRTTSDKAVVFLVEQHLLLGRKLAVVLIHILHALEQAWVENDIVAVLGENRTELLGQGLHVVVGLGAHEAREDRGHTVEQVVVVFALAVVGDGNGVVECGLVGVVDDLRDLLVVAADALHEGGLKILKAYLVEWHRVMGRPIGLHERIFAFLTVDHVSVSVFSQLSVQR